MWWQFWKHDASDKMGRTNRLTIRMRDKLDIEYTDTHWSEGDMRAPWAAFYEWYEDPRGRGDDLFAFRHRRGETMIRRNDIVRVWIEIDGE